MANFYTSTYPDMFFRKVGQRVLTSLATLHCTPSCLEHSQAAVHTALEVILANERACRARAGGCGLHSYGGRPRDAEQPDPEGGRNAQRMGACSRTGIAASSEHGLRQVAWLIAIWQRVKVLCCGLLYRCMSRPRLGGGWM